MIKLSVNINKIATLRNARGENQPDLLKVAKDIQKFGANGITIHPRPDQRHIKFNDVFELKNVITTSFSGDVKKFFFIQPFEKTRVSFKKT